MNAFKLTMVAVFLLMATCASAQQLQPRSQTMTSNDSRLGAAYDAASRAIAAFRSADYKGYTAMMHPSVIEDVGGRDQMIAVTKQGKVTLDEQTDGYDTNVRVPTRAIQGTKNLFTIVPQTVSLRLKNNQSFSRESYLLGISADNGRTWKFIDGGTEPAKIRELVPDFPRTERLPTEPRQ
jgi:hypothetical protein